MTYTSEDWPIAAALLQFPNTTEDGTSVQDLPAEQWAETLREVVDAGFTEVDLTDGWLRPGDLSPARLAEFKDVLREVGLTAPAISAIRRSVIDPVDGDDNLAYSHRTLDAAAALGVPLVSVGLHRPLTEQQRSVLWFWTVPGPQDPVGDQETWDRAVSRLRELADHAAGLGVQLSLEMYEDTYLGTADSAVALLTDIDRDNVGLNPDLGNLLRMQRPIEPWESMVAKTLPHANYWHVKNYYRAEDPATGAVFTTPAPLESGFMNYRKAVRYAVEHGFQGAFCVEHYGGDGLSVSATNREYLRRILPRRSAG
ncbi:sugar phosphate isomerase/epimerase family protein [Goodfellowiella coeruleoviolacea]|uniref:Sugar phosphate isomerase/epimerase n=1 Tax=Goodfellowiella coeruleoviolacea TaxID=334858 RepID=A0AAE3GJC6_9PSEU|nr:sugar phosphate isomerase/epimerase family protein [Goodfellowiella coeruleoviolacea]MCP2167188.1 Sugar phosphate isomerase/epimerase [Goodfellowiella coeruleoviolacea]